MSGQFSAAALARAAGFKRYVLHDRHMQPKDAQQIVDEVVARYDDRIIVRINGQRHEIIRLAARTEKAQ